MPSPFPGMDPYLEDPAEWPSLHLGLAVAAMTHLQPELQRRGYFASAGQRVWLSMPGEAILPDVTLLQPTRPPQQENGTTVEVADTAVRIRRRRIEIHEPFLEIFDAAGRRVVSGIEFVSPSNKYGKAGRAQYRRKQRECRHGGVHLVEVDLIRRGPNICQVPSGVVRERGRSEYLVNVVRAPARDYEFYPIRIRQRLPRVAIPLRTGEPDIVLDLQAVLDAAYDDGAFHMRIDYTRAPTSPLADDDALWADQLLKDKGLR